MINYAKYPANNVISNSLTQNIDSVKPLDKKQLGTNMFIKARSTIQRVINYCRSKDGNRRLIDIVFPKTGTSGFLATSVSKLSL